MTARTSESSSSTETSFSVHETGLQPELLEIGRIGRPHGLCGEVAVMLVTNRPERLLPGARLETDLGLLSIVGARKHGHRYIVTFTGIGSRDQAESLRGLVLRAAPINDPDEWWVHEMIGAEVVDQFGTTRGEVTRVVANPASDLLELGNGVLVPVRFVTAVKPKVRVDVEAPDGLFDVN